MARRRRGAAAGAARRSRTSARCAPRAASRPRRLFPARGRGGRRRHRRRSPWPSHRAALWPFRGLPTPSPRRVRAGSERPLVRESRHASCVSFSGERLSCNALAQTARHGPAARPRPRDEARPRGVRHAAVRGAGNASERPAPAARPLRRRRPRARGRGACAARCPGRDPLRDPGGQGRRGVGCVGRRRHRPARAARAAVAVSRAAVADGRLPLRVHSHGHCGVIARRRRGQRRDARPARANGGLACRGGRRRRLPERHDGRPRRARSARSCRRRRSSPTRRSTPPRSTARSARPPIRRRRSETAAATRWIPRTCARLCVSASRTWPRAQTS